jgi:sugar phosphate isomerase/epimerase
MTSMRASEHFGAAMNRRINRRRTLTMISRRGFVGAMVAIGTLSFVDRLALANPLGLPLGLQLYSVRQQMAQDLEGTLAAVSKAGYTEVEAAALPRLSAREMRAALDRAGLRCVSAHHPFADLQARFDEILAYDKQLGVRFIICASPGRRSPLPAGRGGHMPLTIDDWHFNADQFNAMGERTAAQGIRFGYHNHVPEFAETDGKVPYTELMRLTDPKKVTFELDCGWATVAGMNPVDLMRNHPHRISMLHVKDFHLPNTPAPDPHAAKVTELGLGGIDYHPIFAEAARSQHIKHAFVEQETFDMTWQQALRLDANYLRKFQS